MIRAIHIAFFIALSYNLSAQQDQKMKTLLSEETRISGFISINTGLIPLNGNHVLAMGGEGALVLNNFFLGGYTLRSVEFHSVDTENIYFVEKKLGLSQGGIMTGYSLRTQKLIQWDLMMQIGWGHLSLRSNVNKEILNRDRVNIFTPSLVAKINLTSFAQFCVGVSYQFVFGVDYPSLSNKDFHGVCGLMSLRFGWF